MNRTEMDYYAVLNVPRTATKEEITLAYRKLAIRLCPFRDPKHHRDFVPLAKEGELTHMTPLSQNRQWEYINMAYDVLGDDLHREIYNRFGEAGLFQGIYLPNGYFPPYQYHGDHLKVYHAVFGSYSPYANFIDIITNPPVLYTTREHGIGVRIKDPPIEQNMALELEEIRFGSIKLMHVLRQEFVDAGQTYTEKRKKVLKISIPPGTTAGTRFCFNEEGDRFPTKIPADIVFIAIDKPHGTFKRHPTTPENLIYRHTINLCQAFVGFKFTILTLDNRKLVININQVTPPCATKLMPGEGLPKCFEIKPENITLHGISKIKEFGDLIIEFDITFPIYLTPSMKSFARKFFAEFEQMKCETQTNPFEALLNQ